VTSRKTTDKKTNVFLENSVMIFASPLMDW
jgi:hypothetical protein